jgi:hypothetical protein
MLQGLSIKAAMRAAWPHRYVWSFCNATHPRILTIPALGKREEEEDEDQDQDEEEVQYEEEEEGSICW